MGMAFSTTGLVNVHVIFVFSYGHGATGLVYMRFLYLVMGMAFSTTGLVNVHVIFVFSYGHGVLYYRPSQRACDFCI